MPRAIPALLASALTLLVASVARAEGELPQRILDAVPGIQEVIDHGTLEQKSDLLADLTGHRCHRSAREVVCESGQPKYALSKEDLALVVGRLLAEEGDGSVGEQVLHVVARIHLQEARDAVTKAFAAKSPLLRAEAIRAFGTFWLRLRPQEADLLLADRDKDVRREGMGLITWLYALERAGKLPRVQLVDEMGADGDLERMWGVIEDPKEGPGIQCVAIDGLRNAHARDQAPRMIETMSKLSGYAAYDLAKLLADWKSKEAVPAALALAASNADSERERGLNALAMIGPAVGAAAECLPTIVKALKDPSAPVRGAACYCVCQFRAVDHLGQVAELSTDPDVSVRKSVLATLGELEAKDQAERIAAMVGDNDALVRSGAIQVLAHFGLKDRAKAIAPALHDPEPDVRVSAVRVLGELGAKEYTKDVGSMLHDKDNMVRYAAVVAIRALGASDYRADLEVLQNDPDGSISSAAKAALEGLK